MLKLLRLDFYADVKVVDFFQRFYLVEDFEIIQVTHVSENVEVVCLRC